MSRSRSTGMLLALLAGAVGVGCYEALALQEERGQRAALRDRAAERANELTALRRAHEAALREVAEAERQFTALAPTKVAPVAPSPLAIERDAWLARVKQLMRHFDEHPEQRIPEMRFLDEGNWLRATFAPLGSRVEFRTALASVRSAAQTKFGEQARAALTKYSAAAGDTLPADITALAPYFEPPVEPAILARYEMIRFDYNAGIRGPLAVRLRAPVDAAYDSRPVYYARGSSNTAPMAAWNPDFSARQARAVNAYVQANPGAADNPPFREVVRFFDPPLPADVIEQVEFYEKKNGR